MAKSKLESIAKIIHFPKELKEDLEKAAKSENRSVTNYVVNTVKKDIDEKKKQGSL